VTLQAFSEHIDKLYERSILSNRYSFGAVYAMKAVHLLCLLPILHSITTTAYSKYPLLCNLNGTIETIIIPTADEVDEGDGGCENFCKRNLKRATEDCIPLGMECEVNDDCGRKPLLSKALAEMRLFSASTRNASMTFAAPNPSTMDFPKDPDATASEVVVI
jgi:hypothetical protein